MIESLNRVEVSRSALRHNLRLCQKQSSDTAVMAMVKADAYGHGMAECARVFSNGGVAAFGVAEVVEGMRLRSAGLREPIFILAGILPEFFDALFEYDLTPVLVDDTMVTSLAEEAVRRKKELSVHVKVDAGMGRQGCLPAEAPAVVSAIVRENGLSLAGIMAHFPMADEPVSKQSEEVLACFLETIAGIERRVQKKIQLHIANSAGLFSVHGASLDMVRPGISLYGYTADGSGSRDGTAGNGLQPAMSFFSRVIQVRQVPAGTGLGYGHTFITNRKTSIAVLPVGYEDGYSRRLSNRAHVLLQGQRAPVIGRISMNLTLADITDIVGVQTGDEAVLLGSQGQERITADDLAGWQETISYEVLCMLGHCNTIKYID